MMDYIAAGRIGSRRTGPRRQPDERVRPPLYCSGVSLLSGISVCTTENILLTVCANPKPLNSKFV